MNLDYSSLLQRIGESEGIVYCYIVRTVKSVNGQYVQSGSAPNFQGGLITLNTCKWLMRTGRDLDAWRGTWIAGITGAETGPHNRGYLFYLMRVGQTCASHCGLWQWLGANAPKAAEAKAADEHRHGDVYRPKRCCSNPFDPDNYVAPRYDHVHSPGAAWHRDIDYVGFQQRRPALLVGDPRYSFLWSTPRILVPFQVGRGCKKANLDELLAVCHAGRLGHGACVL